jgi:hypothetical protein
MYLTLKTRVYRISATVGTILLFMEAVGAPRKFR